MGNAAISWQTRELRVFIRRSTLSSPGHWWHVRVVVPIIPGAVQWWKSRNDDNASVSMSLTGYWVFINECFLIKFVLESEVVFINSSRCFIQGVSDTYVLYTHTRTYIYIYIYLWRSVALVNDMCHHNLAIYFHHIPRVLMDSSWFRWWHGTCLVPSHYLNHHSMFGNWQLGLCKREKTVKFQHKGDIFFC